MITNLNKFIIDFLSHYGPDMIDKWKSKDNQTKFTGIIPKKNRNRKLCSEPDCKAYARDKKTGKCRRHLGGLRCTESDCKNSAADSLGKCKRHLGGLWCTEPECKTGARGNSGKCVKHGGNLCSESGCKASVQSNTNKCIRHTGGRRCSEKGCKTGAHSMTKKCIRHGEPKKCTEKGCNTVAKGIIKKCSRHRDNKRCPNCITWPDSRHGNNKYDGYCATCFKRVFPDDERSKVIYQHTKEIMVRNIINLNFDGFIHDIPLYTGSCDCTHRRRIDHRKLIGNTIFSNRNR